MRRVHLIRYRDTYRRTSGTWLITSRHVTIDWTERRPVEPPYGS